MNNTLVPCESISVFLQSCYEYVVFVYSPHKLSVTGKMEYSAPRTYHNALGPAMNGLATQVACFPLLHGMIGASS